jgi:hypothetical protein
LDYPSSVEQNIWGINLEKFLGPNRIFPMEKITNYYGRIPTNAQAFFVFGTHNNKIHTFYKKQLFLFWFFPCCCFAFISKAATTKNLQFIYDLSMLGPWYRPELFAWRGHIQIFISRRLLQTENKFEFWTILHKF